MSDEELVDIAGNTIADGDTVVYPQMSGRSVQMVLGKLVGYNGKTAQIERVEGGRWSPGYQRTKHRDTRTGENVSIWTNDWRHWAVKPSTTYVHPETGKVLTEAEYHSVLPYDERRKYERKREPGKLHDYIEEFKDPLKPVTIRNVENIVRVVVA